MIVIQMGIPNGEGCMSNNQVSKRSGKNAPFIEFCTKPTLEPIANKLLKKATGARH